MPILNIVHYPDPVLLKVGKPLGDEDFAGSLSSVAEDMFETMYKAGGVGLAAPQVGISKRLFVMDVPKDGSSDKFVLVNPEIVAVEGEQIGEEGCLSFPGLYQTVKREMRVVVRASDVSGEPFELDLTGLSARCVLHETDHCDGIVFLDRMTMLRREIAKQKIKRMIRTGKWDQ
jgi:peptide deformylase